MVKESDITSSLLVNSTSGEPQGSHSGPVYFSIFANVINQVFQSCKVLLFVDDPKVLKTVVLLTVSALFLSNTFEFFCFMVLNVAKCKVMKYTS